MSSKEFIMKTRTTDELSIVVETIGAIVFVGSIVSLFFAKSFLAAFLILLVPTAYFTVIYLAVKLAKNALMLNIIDYKGVRNQYFGNVMCDMEWNEIGDFGVAQVKHGIFRGRYIYMSRIFVTPAIRRDIIKNYDPRVCIVLPYTRQTCAAVCEASGEKIYLN